MADVFSSNFSVCGMKRIQTTLNVQTFADRNFCMFTVGYVKLESWKIYNSGK